MVDIKVNDVIVDSGRLYVVLDVDVDSQTMDVKCYNEPLVYRAVPIANLDEPGVEVLSTVPENIKFLPRRLT